jgi:hypothetical protein
VLDDQVTGVQTCALPICKIGKRIRPVVRTGLIGEEGRGNVAMGNT